VAVWVVGGRFSAVRASEPIVLCLLRDVCAESFLGTSKSDECSFKQAWFWVGARIIHLV